MNRLSCRECLPPVQNLSVFLCAVKDLKRLYVKLYNYVCFIWIRNLASHIKSSTKTVFKNRMLRRMLGPEREDVTGVKF